MKPEDINFEFWFRQGAAFGLGKALPISGLHCRAQAAWDAGVASVSERSHTEKQTIASTEHPGAKKYDGGKAPIGRGLLERFPRALRQVALVSEYGARKYGTYDGWEKLPDAFQRYNDGHGRHDNARYIEGEYDDGDSGLPHLAQRAWNALATLELALRNEMIDERRGNDIGEDGKPVLGSNMATEAK